MNQNRKSHVWWEMKSLLRCWQSADTFMEEQLNQGWVQRLCKRVIYVSVSESVDSLLCFTVRSLTINSPERKPHQKTTACRLELENSLLPVSPNCCADVLALESIHKKFFLRTWISSLNAPHVLSLLVLKYSCQNWH